MADVADRYTETYHLLGSAVGAFAVVPSDLTQFAQPSRALYIGGDGDLTVTFINDTVATFAAVPAGSLLPFRVKKVLSSGTTASLIVAVY